eukprot:scaffold397884_cov14-Prasinocladus_malaysianus.AAC.1
MASPPSAIRLPYNHFDRILAALPSTVLHFSLKTIPLISQTTYSLASWSTLPPRQPDYSLSVDFDCRIATTILKQTFPLHITQITLFHTLYRGLIYKGAGLSGGPRAGQRHQHSRGFGESPHRPQRW